MTTMSRCSMLLLALAACSGDGGKDGATDATDTDTDTDAPTTEETDAPTLDTVEVAISAATGGTVEAFGAVLEIPAGSLAADTTITVSLTDPSGQPDAATVLGQVFDLGPDGTTFDPPATLTLPTGGAPATGTTQVVSWLDGAAWVDLASTVGDGVVTAPVAHFTDFAAREVAAEALGCSAFAPCGGDVTGGEWTQVLRCGSTRSETWLCSGTYVNEYTITGGYTFDAGGGFTKDTDDGTLRTTQTVTAECMPAITTCDELYSPSSGFTCTGDVGVSCECTSEYPISGSYEATVGTWSVTGAELTLTTEYQSDAGPAEDVDVLPFCVSGNTLTLMEDDGSVHVYTR